MTDSLSPVSLPLDRLPRLVIGGVDVRTDGGALDQHGHLHLLGLIGTPSRIKPVCANLWEGKPATLLRDPDDLGAGVPVRIVPSWGFRRTAPHALAGGRIQVVFLPARTDATRLEAAPFTIVRQRGAEAAPLAEIHLTYARRVLDTPLPPLAGLADWLLARARASGEITELDCWGRVAQAWSCQPRADALEADLTRALRGDDLYGVLRGPDADMEREQQEEVA